MIDLNQEQKPKVGPIPAFNRSTKAVEWWNPSPEGRRIGNPKTGITKSLDDHAYPLTAIQVDGYVRQGWIRFDPCSTEKDYVGLTDADVANLVKFCNGNIASSKRGLIFAFVREWRIYREWYRKLEEERSQKAETQKPVGYDALSPMPPEVAAP